ncbi:hypothetical protein [Poseidonocella sp. HB161398]|uniref:hypothetical protein n=1 Tax=Poseidonocella sp. HB161398 TaxID=2320855 RepID=UPI001107AAF4|nr:hypothetical protein [Poseidonocella sp. HB161398]
MSQILSPRTIFLVAISGFAGLSVHVIAQQVFDVPYPSGSLGFTRMEAALLALARHAAFYAISAILVASLKDRSRWTKLAVLFFCSAAFYEELLRVPVMQGLVTGAWAFSLLPQLALYAKALLFSVVVLLSAALAAPFEDRLRRYGLHVLGAMIAALFLFAFDDLLPVLQQFLMQFATPPGPEDQLLSQDYGALILIPAYLTYIVPTYAMYLYFRAFAAMVDAGAVAVCLLYMALLAVARGTALIALMSIGPGFLSVFQFTAQILVATALICVFFRDDLAARAPKAGSAGLA